MDKAATASGGEGRWDMESLIKSLEQLPSPPHVATRILSSVSDEDEFEEIADLVRSDPAMAGKVLRLANSPAYGRHSQVNTVEDAMLVLGASTLRTILLGSFIRDTVLKKGAGSDPAVTGVWKHSLLTASTARLLAARLYPSMQQRAFTSGMVHDLGKMALLCVRPHRYERFLDRVERGGLEMLRAEQEALGVDHCQAGKWLAEHWGLPGYLVEVVWLHHHPWEALREAAAHPELLDMVCMANRIAHEIAVDYAEPHFANGTRELAEKAGFDAQTLEGVRGEVVEEFTRTAALFDMEIEPGEVYLEALGRANSKLCGMGVRHLRERELLDRCNAVLRASASMAPRLACAEDVRQLAARTAEDMAEHLPHSSGALLIRGRSGMVRVASWRKGKPVECENGPKGPRRPKSLEGPLREAFARAAALLGGESAPAEPLQGDGVLVLPIASPAGAESAVAENWLQGRLLVCLSAPGGGSPSTEEVNGLWQICQLLAANLERLQLRASLHKRAEDLSRAMIKLNAAREKARHAERLATVGQLAAGTAHEINNPLSIVYARAQIMEQKEDDPAKKKNLGQMLSQLDRISNILQHLMDFARPAPPVMEDLSLNDLVRDALELMRDGLEDNGIEVRTDLDDSLPPVRGDQDQLQSLLVNLLLNGQQAMLEKGVENPSLALSTHLDDSGDKAVLRVRDTGPGIPTDVVDRVFEPFFTTKEQGSGTGLGLSICYGIVQSHNGVIRLQNAAGGGAEAVVWLPLAPAAAPAESREPRRADVLVVDDEDYIRELLRETLNSAGFGVETAVDGQEARDRLLSKRYRLVLLDLRMPRREGMEVLRDIRAGGVNTPVIVLTGAASDEEVRMAKGLGAVSAVRKPFKVDELLALARRTMAPAEKQ